MGKKVASADNVQDLRITSAAEIAQKFAAVTVALPSFDGDDEPFVVKAKRVSLFNLVSKGVLPNSLLPLVQKFMAAQNGSKDNPMQEIMTDGDMLSKFTEMTNRVCEAVMVEPRFTDPIGDDLTVGDAMTDMQKVCLFLFSQQGVKALESFREQQRAALKAIADSKGIRGNA
jgi:hypothetical protein